MGSCGYAFSSGRERGQNNPAVSPCPLSFCAGRVSATRHCSASLGYPTTGKGQPAEPRAIPGRAPLCGPQIRGTKGEATEATESTVHSTALPRPLILMHLLLPTMLASWRLQVHLWPWHSPLLVQTDPYSVFRTPDVLSGLQQAGRLVKARQCNAYHCPAYVSRRS